MVQRKFTGLFNQITKIVVWMSLDEFNYDPPVLDSNLVLIHYRGSTDILLWKEFSNYQLYLISGEPIARNTTDIDINQTKIQRTKAYALQYITAGIDYHYTRLGYKTSLNHLRGINLAESKWISLYQDEFNCSSTEALKLINFKLDEYNSVVYRLESIRLKFINQLKAATSVDIIDNIYHSTAIAIMKPYHSLLDKLFI